MQIKYRKDTLFDLSSPLYTVALSTFSNLVTFISVLDVSTVHSRATSKPPFKTSRGCRSGKRVSERRNPLVELSNLSALSDTRPNVGRPTESSLTDLPVIERSDSLPVNDYANEPPPILRPVTFNARRGLPNFLVCNTRSLCNKTEDFEAVIRHCNFPLFFCVSLLFSIVKQRKLAVSYDVV